MLSFILPERRYKTLGRCGRHPVLFLCVMLFYLKGVGSPIGGGVLGGIGGIAGSSDGRDHDLGTRWLLF